MNLYSLEVFFESTELISKSLKLCRVRRAIMTNNKSLKRHI